MVLLRYTARSGRVVTLPVLAARSGWQVVVLVGHAGSKRWWRHFLVPSALTVLVGRQWVKATGLVVGADADSVEIYRSAHPRLVSGDEQVFVAITLDQTPGRSMRRRRSLCRRC